jgi:hypothetical protein
LVFQRIEIYFLFCLVNIEVTGKISRKHLPTKSSEYFEFANVARRSVLVHTKALLMCRNQHYLSFHIIRTVLLFFTEYHWRLLRGRLALSPSQGSKR